MNPLSTLRVLLAIAVLSALGAGLCDALYLEAVPLASREAFKALLATRQLDLGAGAAVAAVAYELALLTAVLGMAFRKRWALPLGIVVTVATMAQAVVFGPHAYSGMAFMLSYVSKVAWGGALAFAYWLRLSPSDSTAQVAAGGNA